MKSLLRLIFVMLVMFMAQTINGVSSLAFAHTPAEFLEVVRVTPSSPVDHSVEVQSVLGSKRIAVNLVGPELFSGSVACLNYTTKRSDAYLNWYRISNPTPEPQKKIFVLDVFRGGDKTELMIGAPEFILCPSQKITAGPPAAIPEGLDQMMAYRIDESVDLRLAVDLASSKTSTKRIVGRPIYVCVPVNQWHHDDHVAATHPQDVLVVYQIDSQPAGDRVSTIDQFGLNQLRSATSEWLCVRAKLVDAPSN